MGWTSIYKLSRGSLGTKVLTHPQLSKLRCHLAQFFYSRHQTLTVHQIQPDTGSNAAMALSERLARKWQMTTNGYKKIIRSSRIEYISRKFNFYMNCTVYVPPEQTISKIIWKTGSKEDQHHHPEPRTETTLATRNWNSFQYLLFELDLTVVYFYMVWTSMKRGALPPSHFNKW